MTSEVAPPVSAGWSTWLEGRRLLVVVFVLGALHAGLYAASFPPWAIEDEQQHVDYVWKLAFDQRLPDLEDPLDDSIVEAIAGTDRWEDYDLARPSAPTAEGMGLEGRSYAAYHPPLGYLALAPAARFTGDRALALLYVLRGSMVVAAGLVCVLTTILARTWFDFGPANGARPGSRRFIGAAAGLSVAALPAVAESGGRVNTDILAAVAVLGCVVLIMRWLRDPSLRGAWLVGGALALAALTRETTIVLAVPVLVAGVVAVQRGQLTWSRVVGVIVPPALAVLAWEAVVWRSTGSLDGSSAFRDLYGSPFAAGLGGAGGDLVERAFVPYGVWPLPPFLTLVLAVTLLVGLGLALRRGWVIPAVMASGVLVAQIVLLGYLVDAGHNVVSARILLPCYPLVVAAATLGWATWRSRAAVFVPTIVTVALGLWFALGSFLPRHPPRLG